MFFGDCMMKKFISKINQLSGFSVLVFKIETSLSIFYFSMVLIYLWHLFWAYYFILN